MACRPPPKLAIYEVYGADGETYTVEAHFAFNNNGSLVFRRSEDGSGCFEIAAEFAPDTWKGYNRTRFIEEN
jgi:hypothetical protein